MTALQPQEAVRYLVQRAPNGTTVLDLELSYKTQGTGQYTKEWPCLCMGVNQGRLRKLERRSICLIGTYWLYASLSVTRRWANTCRPPSEELFKYATKLAWS